MQEIQGKKAVFKESRFVEKGGTTKKRRRTDRPSKGRKAKERRRRDEEEREGTPGGDRSPSFVVICALLPDIRQRRRGRGLSDLTHAGAILLHPTNRLVRRSPLSSRISYDRRPLPPSHLPLDRQFSSSYLHSVILMHSDNFEMTDRFLESNYGEVPFPRFS